MFILAFACIASTLTLATLAAKGGEYSIYQGIPLGFATAIKRNEPFVLLRTAMGVQILSGNNTMCYNNGTSMYYANEAEITFMGYSSEDNYLVTTDKEILRLPNLIKSEWNNAIGSRLKKECQRKTVNANIFALSISRHILYALGVDGKLSTATIRNTKCNINVPGSYPDADLLHVTNFAKDQDYVLVGYSTKGIIEVLTIGGDPSHTFNLDARQTLRAIDSVTTGDVIADQWNHYFLLVESEGTARVLRYKHLMSNKTGGVNHTLVLEQVALKAVALSVSKHLVGALLTKDHQTFSLHLVPNVANGARSSNASTIYTCAAGPDLKGLLVVDQQVLPPQDICRYISKQTNSSICASTFDGAFCGRKTIFYFPTHTKLNETLLDSELKHKVVLTGAIAVMCFILLTLFQQVNG